MHILCFGINHITSPVHQREKLIFSEEAARQALSQAASSLQDVLEMAILSTCNRTEIYALTNHPQFDELEAYLAEVHGVALDDFRESLYRYSDREAANHLLRVATGLDSLILGEPQILGQVKRAYELALEVGVCRTVLSRLFRTAIHTGKRARTETAIGRNPTSVSSLAAVLAEKQVEDLSTAQVVVVGAGEMAELAVEALRKRGAGQISLINRTLERAEFLANRWQAQFFSFEHLGEILVGADIVITSTSASQPLISVPYMTDIMAARLNRKIVLVDIAVPRDVDPDVRKIPGVKLFDMDTLTHQVSDLLAERASEVPLVEAIIAEELDRLQDYLETTDMIPIISELRRQAEEIRQSELERTLRRLPRLSDLERNRIEAMTRSLIKRLLEGPTERLRAEANCPHASEYATVARTLFDLSNGSSICAFSNQMCSSNITVVDCQLSNSSSFDPRRTDD